MDIPDAWEAFAGAGETGFSVGRVGMAGRDVVSVNAAPVVAVCGAGSSSEGPHKLPRITSAKELDQDSEDLLVQEFCKSRGFFVPRNIVDAVTI